MKRESTVLRFSEDRRAVATLVFHFALVAGIWMANPSGWGVLGAVLVGGFSSFIQLILVHNAMHSPVFQKRIGNQIWLTALSLGFCYPASVFVPVHNLSHHRHLQTPRDILLTTDLRHSCNLLNLIHYVFRSTWHLHSAHALYLWKVGRKQRKWFRQFLLETVTLTVAISCLVYLDGTRFLVLVLLPSVLGQCTIVGLGYLQHDGCDETSTVNNSRDFTGNVFNWLIFDNGFHTVHHNRPGLHWSKGRDRHLEEIAEHSAAGLSEPSILAYMWRSFGWPNRRERYDGSPVVLTKGPRSLEVWSSTFKER